MPELPDVQVYLEALQKYVGGDRIERVRLISPFVLRTVDPPLRMVHGKRVTSVSRLGKRLVLELEGDLFLVIHLMIAGRLRWRSPDIKLNRKTSLAAIDFSTGSLLFTEVSKKKRASLHVVSGRDGLAALDPGGLEVLDAGQEDFVAALQRENRTLKRALTDPRILSGIGNAYSDEILHAARLSPMKRSRQLRPEEATRLYEASREVLTHWIDVLRREVGDAFPEKVTAFRPQMAVHGRYRQPCPTCGAPVQRIVYAENECNYCPPCQTDGKLLADRALSKLLREDWPKTLEELEEKKRGAG